MKRLLSVPRALLSALLRHPRIIIELAVVILGALIWFGGPRIGVSSVETRVQLIIVVSVLRLLVYLIAQVVVNRKAARLEASLNRQAHEQAAAARPDHRDELITARRQFEQGIAALKSSKLGRGKGKTALYALPWYMFIGPPGSGKTTALLHSGLHFPYLGGTEKVRGVGGTRNCDWWFTNEAVLLDTAGRYMTQDEDQDEWLEFLDLLKQHRKGKPINGVLAAISIAQLIQSSDEALEDHAKKMRNRIDELIKRLGIVFPVYLVFTKCDLIQGFVEFFEDLNRSERERIWGCTFSKLGWSSEAPAPRFKSELTQLLAALNTRRLRRLASIRGSHKINVFGFPLQLASSQDKLTRFIEVLFQSNPYQENPLFRGFYFTSGTQEGTPIDQIMGVVGKASGLSDVVVSSLSTGEVKSYFLKNLFTNVIFPDQVLAGPSSVAHRQRGYLRLAVFIVAVVGVLSSMTALAVSFVGNQQLLDGTRSAAFVGPDPSLSDPASMEKNISILQRLGSRFEKLRSYEEEHVPLRLWGLYRGSQLFKPVRSLYLKYFTMVMLEPMKREMEENLGAFVRDDDPNKKGSDYYYGLLKAYMMLGDPVHLNPEYIQRWLADLWKGRLKRVYGTQAVPASVQEDGIEQLRIYSYHLSGQEASHVYIHGPLVHEAQVKLRQVPMLDRMYAMVRHEAQDVLKPFTLETASASAQSILVSEYTIPGMFTYDGWRGPFKKALAKTIQDLGDEGWVIGEQEKKRADLEQAVKKQYFDDYVRYWRGFVRSLRIRPAATPSNTEEILAGLSQPNSPLLQTFQSIDSNTVPDDGLSVLQGAATGILDKVKKGLGLEPGQEVPTNAIKDVTSTDFSRSVSTRFKSLHHLVSIAKDSKDEPPLGRYIGELRKVHQTLKPVLSANGSTPDTTALAKSIVSGQPNDILQAFKTTEGLMQVYDSDTQEALLPLFYEPWIMAMRGVMERAKTEIARRWESEVYQPCQRNIESRYPFRGTGEDAAMADVVEFFHPQNGNLWRVYETELKPFVEEGVDRWQPKTWHGVGMTFTPEFLASLEHARLVSDGLFPRGASDLGVTFEVYPHPPQGGASRMVSEILLELGGQTLRYRMEPQEWHELKWPGSVPISGASLKVQVGTSWMTVGREYKDWWGLFRLLNEGRLVPQPGDVQYRVQWDLQTGEERPILIQYDLRTRSHKNPFHPGLFEQFRCIQRI